MSDFSQQIVPFVDKELELASKARRNKNFDQEFRHLENAHILGQASTYLHTKVHCLMLLWGLRQKQPKEVFGQLLRIIGAFSKTAFGLVPEGNTGGSNVSPVKTMALSKEHSLIISRAKKHG